MSLFIVFVAACASARADVASLAVGADGASAVVKSAAFASTAGGVDLNGFFQPTSVSWDDRGHVFVALKPGTILVFPSWTAPATAAATIVDIQNVVSSFGDHGLTSVLWDRDDSGNAWLYATYMKNRWTYGDANCNDCASPSRSPRPTIPRPSLHRPPSSRTSVPTPKTDSKTAASTPRLRAATCTAPSRGGPSTTRAL